MTELIDYANLACLNKIIMILDSIGKKAEIFDGQARVLHTGTEFGCVHPSDPNFATQFQRLRALTGQEAVLAQKLGFNTRITPIQNSGDISAHAVEGFYRTPEVSDGVVVSITGDTFMKIAVMIMNADCGVIKILAPNGEIAVLHGGFDNVDNKDGTSIVDNAVKYFVGQGFNPKQLKFSIGEASQACCYGLNNPVYQTQNEDRRDRIVQAYGKDVVRPVINPPRSRNEGIGFDVPLIAARQADKAGIKDIEVEGLCTSCHELVTSAMEETDTFGTWYSNLRENDQATKARGYGMRNAVVVY